MSSKQRQPILRCDPYVIDVKGRVFNSSTRKLTTLVGAAQAASLWNDYGHASNFSGHGDVTDSATGKTPTGRPIVDSSELVNRDDAPWLWHLHGFPDGKARLSPPRNTLDSCGNRETGWALLRCVGFETLFHAPSMAAYLFGNDKQPTRVVGEFHE